MGGHLLVAAHPRLGERDDPVGARLGDQARAVQERLDSFSRIGRSRREIDSHRSSLVETSLEQAGLLEHADEYACISFGHQRGEVVRIDEPVGDS